MKQGMLAEAKHLHENGLSWKRMEALGLEYRFLARLLRGSLTRAQFLAELELEINHFVKRQMTYWKRNKNIEWFDPKEVRKIEERMRGFLG